MCVADFCQHGGTCDLTSVDTATIQVECSCTEGYSGPQCENNKSNYGIIAFVVVALFVLIFFYWRHRRNRKLFHVFISYRVATDADLARRICRRLSQVVLQEKMTIKCYLDQKDIESGTDWEASFMSGLKASCLYLPLISEPGTKGIEDVSVFDDVPDNFLLEIETALRMYRQKRIGILPLFVGTETRADTTAGDDSSVRFRGAVEKFSAFDCSRFPNGPSKTNKKTSVRSTMKQLFKIQGVFVGPLCSFTRRVSSCIIQQTTSVCSRKVFSACFCVWNRLVRSVAVGVGL
eukprot:m.1043391 g.1043391  ORF g.1043391 m.1043391 type:complete len:291 (-) comp24168_c0_seq7:135-1007(-)